MLCGCLKNGNSASNGLSFVILAFAVSRVCVSRECFRISAGEIKDATLRIGDTYAPVYTKTFESGASTAKVPDIVFYDNAQHLSVMQDMLQDYILGEHILLVGNQVCGGENLFSRRKFV